MGVNYIVIVASALVGLGISALWFSPLLFFEELGHTPHLNNKTLGFSQNRYAPATLVIEFILLLITSYILVQFDIALHINTIIGACVLAFWLWFGFQIPVLFKYLTEGNFFVTFFIHASHRLLTLVVLSIIVSTWS